VEDKRQKIQEWFDIPKPKFPVGAVVFGALLAIMGFALAANGGNGTGAGLGVLALGAIVIAIPTVGYSGKKKKYEGRPPVDQMLRWLREDCEALKAVSLNKLGLDPSELKGESIIVRGPLFSEQRGLRTDEIAKRRRIDENVPDSPYLYACWTYMVIHFAANVMGTYKCSYNWYRNAAVNDATEEFGYESVVSVKTETESSAYTLIDKTLQNAFRFVLTLTGGNDPITVRLCDPAMKSASEEEDKTLGEKAVQRIRTLKRDRAAAAGR
jgi:hypothetical protein